MSARSASWSGREIAQVISVAVAPALVVLCTAVIFAVLTGDDLTLVAVFALPLAYGTLLLTVLFPPLRS